MTHTTENNGNIANHSRRRFFGLVASGVAAAVMTSVMLMNKNSR